MREIHYVKSWSYLFQSIKSGLKLHDIRDSRDRNYKVNDILVLNEFDQSKGEYTGKRIFKKISYITDRNVPCALSSTVLDRNFCILSLVNIDKHDVIFITERYGETIKDDEF